ncbi:MAG: hypothetical protein E7077_03340 [Bacteroidales bacterium]|jgi:hypothetical protein|nr:hypothetical protein [Bacteroidales bacterium]
MKIVRSILFFATSLCTIVANAQDVVIFRNGEETEVKVEEITPNEVKYKKTSNPDGPSYIFNKDDIFMIKYKNGEKDVFAPEAEVQVQQAESQSKPVIVKDVTVKRKSPSGLASTYNGAFLTEHEAMNYLADDYNEFSEQSDRMKKGFNLMLTGAILSAASATLCVASIAAGHWEDGYDDYWYDHYGNRHYYNCDYDDCEHFHPNVPFMVTSIACGVASSITLPIGIVKFATGKARCHKMLKRHYKTTLNNDDKISSYDNSMTFKMNAKPNGFSLSLTF